MGSPETRLGHTPWQTVGPYFHYALPWTACGILAGPQTRGERIEIIGQVFDADRVPVSDAMIEIWQANAEGRYRHPDDAREELAVDLHFIGFGRAPTDATGTFRFSTIRPGRVPGPGNTLQAAHIAVSVLGRGLLKRLVTRLYFAGAPENGEDPVLGLVEESRRSTLLAVPEPGAPGTWRFDIVLQGAGETVFFEV
jgi:protocatechuate 3,4-dioxygenase, alpha subunit